MSGTEVQAVDTKEQQVEAHTTDAAAIVGAADSQPTTADDIPTPALPSGHIPEDIQDQSMDTKDTISATQDMTSDSNGITSMQLPNGNEDNQVDSTSKPTTTDTAITLMNGETINDASATNDRPWDFSNRKVIIQGVDKYHDVKTATKMLHKWLDSAKTTTSSPFVIDKLKKPPKSNWLVVTLQSESMIQPFIDYINTSQFKSRKGDTVFAKMPQSNHNDDDNDTNNRNPNGNRKRRQRNEDDDGARDNGNETGDTTTLNHNTTKRQRRSIDDSTARRPISQEELYNRVIPLWNLSPTEQASHKMKEMIKKCAMKIIIEIKNKFRALEKEKSRTKMSIYPWILQQRCIDMQPIVTAPTPLRNKCEMTFGYQYTFPAVTSSHNECEATIPDESNVVAANVDVPDVAPASDLEPTKVPAVGFMVTGWAGGVSFSNTLPNVPYEVSMIVDIVNKFLSDSPLEPYDCTTHTGFWRILTIRTSRRTNECMIIILHNGPPSELKASGATSDPETPVDCTTIVANEKERLLSLLINADLLTVPSDQDAVPTVVKVTSLFFQEFSGLSHPSPEHPVQHAYGATYLTEQLGDCRFQISPGAFFQVNTEGAEILYQLVVDKIREISQPDPQQTLLFDVCCGTGTIGITCLKAGVVGQVVGVDISEPAIADANRNAVLNGYTTNGTSDAKAWNETRFVASRAELVLGREIQNATQRPRPADHHGATEEMKFVAVVDPAREGLHADVVKAIRGNQRIIRLVYVSCNPTVTLVRDAALLCSPPTKRYTGRPFRITSAQPVDMFPLTNHCEMVMTFDRLSEKEM